MYDNFTESAREVMRLAELTRLKIGHEHLGTGHVLVGLCGCGHILGIASTVLYNLGVNPAVIEKRVTDAPRYVRRYRAHKFTLRGAPTTDGVKHVIVFATEEAKREGSRYVGTEHLLLGVMQLTNSTGSQILVSTGVLPVSVRDEIRRLTGRGFIGQQAVSRDVAECPRVGDASMRTRTKADGMTEEQTLAAMLRVARSQIKLLSLREVLAVDTIQLLIEDKADSCFARSYARSVLNVLRHKQSELVDLIVAAENKEAKDD